MSDPRFLTSEQASAVTHTACSVALRAGAGTGKTRVLTEKFLSLLDGPNRLPLGRIVALTFTDKAARELRGRVRETCRLQLRAGSDPSYWRTILVGLEAAPIGTFHAFCGQVLRRFAIEAGIEPGSRVLDEPMAEALREEALKKCVLTWLDQADNDFIPLATELGVSTARDIVGDLIESRTRLDPADWSERAPEAIVSRWKTFLTATVWPNHARELLAEARPLLELLKTPVSTSPVMRQRSDFLLENLPLLGNHASAGRLIDEIIGNARIQGVTAKTFCSEETHQDVKVGLTHLRDQLKESQKLLECDEPATLRAAAACGSWARLTKTAIETYQRTKRQQGALDFDDLLARTLELLEARPKAVRAWLEGEIAHVLVDEFQDTDPIQSAIIRHLTGAAWSRGKLFVVGDPKQSIYGFRGARPELFDTYRAELPAEGRYQLTGNFRGVPELIDFTNDLFQGVFEEGDAPALSPGRPELRDPARTVIEFLWAGEAQPNEKPTADERRKVEARWIARHIHDNLKSKWTVRDEVSGDRPAQPRDVVLLFRTLNDSALYESALADVGLDYYVVGGKSFYGQQEVLDLINLLTLLNDPHDALALAATLRGPFGCVSDEGLYWLAQAGSGDLVRGFPMWESLSELNAGDRASIGRIHELLDRWSAEKDWITVAELVERVLDESGVEAALMGEFLGERRLANVRKLARMARGFEGDQRFSVAEFVARLRANWNKPPREEQAATTDEHAEAVRLMTVHQAKGLEFPIVVVVDLNRDSQDPVTRGVVAGPSELGIVVKSGGDEETGESTKKVENLGWLLHQERARQTRKAEDLRLFYVAVTRARDRLILSAGLGVEEPPKSKALELLHERFDRATGTRRDAFPSETEPPRVRVITEGPMSDTPRRRSMSSPRPRPRRLARIIGLTPIQPESPPAQTRRDPARYFDLTPDHGSGSHTARVERLFRAILADPAALDPSRRIRIARALARRQIPIAPPAIEEKALERVEVWSKTALSLRSAQATEVVRNVEWVHTLSAESGQATVLRGLLDLAFRNANQGWTVVIHAHEEAGVEREKARLLGSIVAASARGMDPVQCAWLVRSGAEPEMMEFTDLSGAEVERRIRALLSGRSATRAVNEFGSGKSGQMGAE